MLNRVLVCQKTAVNFFLMNIFLPSPEDCAKDNKDQFVKIMCLSLYFFCCVNNKFECLLVIFTTFSYFVRSFLFFFYFRAVMCELSNIKIYYLLLFFSCAILFWYFRTSHWSGFHSQIDLFIYFLNFFSFSLFKITSFIYAFPTLFISQLFSIFFDWYFFIYFFSSWDILLFFE